MILECKRYLEGQSPLPLVDNAWIRYKIRRNGYKFSGDSHYFSFVGCPRRHTEFGQCYPSAGP